MLKAREFVKANTKRAFASLSSKRERVQQEEGFSSSFSVESESLASIEQAFPAAPDEGKDKALRYEDILRRDGILVTTNVGTSMMPLIRQGRDLIAVQAFEPLDAEEGLSQGEAASSCPRAQRYDAVLYKRGERYILHRVLEVSEKGYTICGDNCIRCEKDVPESALLGVLVHVDRDGHPLPVDMHWQKRGNVRPPLRYRAYVHVWCDLYPARAAALSAKHRCFGALRRVKNAVRAGR